NQATHLGTLLDSYGDFATYMTVPVCAWWLWPDLIRREAWDGGAIVAAYVFPIVLGYLKDGRLTAYHTYGAKLSAVVVGASALALFAGGPPAPFRPPACLSRSASRPGCAWSPSSKRSRSRRSCRRGTRTSRRSCTRGASSAARH